jgi:ribosome-binding protein aMBF1 (putative translation factor)
VRTVFRDTRKALRRLIDTPGVEPGRNYRELGDALRTAREERGLSLAAVQEHLLLSDAQVRGLESGDAAAFHGPRFFERALERYVRLLGLEAAPRGG